MTAAAKRKEAAGPREGLASLQAAGQVNRDPAQEKAAERLQVLHDELASWRTSQPERGGFFARIGLRKPAAGPEAPRGVYMHGPVGRGKSMLMDLFYATAPVAARRRVHFHAFMGEIHDRVHAWRQSGHSGDPLPDVAAAVAKEARLLCFDEFQVDNITDAMILGRLFEALFREGVTVVATSNVAPANLYRDGLQREAFLPFIDLIREKLDVVELDSGTDYRLDRLKGQQVYFVPADAENRARLENIFADLAGGEGARTTLKVKGREIVIERATEGVAFVTFGELCARALGSGDYLALARRFDTLVLEGIPKLTSERRDLARRFVNLIDALYEHRVHLVCSADALPHELYPEGDGAFVFQRTASRLMEMQADDYIAQVHRD